MSSSYGENLRITIFGQSHSPAIGVTMEGLPPALPVDLEELEETTAESAPASPAPEATEGPTPAEEIKGRKGWENRR